ncbi:hypothetical protein Gogos_006482 [Gossypium gossypioides]|uniref:ULTRAPETALA1/2 zinc finger domain-containing protein n=1 Tax=Gossypium gossypioides TaxID=34282 RepID=A0A7J9C600_GOSGO|nr:hypothetical protein [Gossypium gossypioides]
MPHLIPSLRKAGNHNEKHKILPLHLLDHNYTLIICYMLCRIHFGSELTYIQCFRITCDDDEERASRRVYRGCSRSPTCKGCTSCVCFGCEICRFTDCSCQTCIDFIRNAEA